MPLQTCLKDLLTQVSKRIQRYPKDHWQDSEFPTQIRQNETFNIYSKMLRINLSHPFPDHASHFWPKLKKKPPHLWVGGLFMGEFFDLHPGLCLAGQPTLPGPRSRNSPEIKAY